jgi:hypothetical protein
MKVVVVVVMVGGGVILVVGQAPARLDQHGLHPRVRLAQCLQGVVATCVFGDGDGVRDGDGDGDGDSVCVCIPMESYTASTPFG